MFWEGSNFASLENINKQDIQEGNSCSPEFKPCPAKGQIIQETIYLHKYMIAFVQKAPLRCQIGITL